MSLSRAADRPKQRKKRPNIGNYPNNPAAQATPVGCQQPYAAPIHGSHRQPFRLLAAVFIAALLRIP